MKEQLKKLKEEILSKLTQTKSADLIKELEVKYLGRKGELNQILKSISEASEDERRELGAIANTVKEEITSAFEKAKKAFSENTNEDKDVDPTMPGAKIKSGHIHPISSVFEKLENSFSALGFMVVDGPELESDYYCFQALNIPTYHPARDMQDTFYVDKKNDKGEYDLVMRTQTSPVQIRAMQKYGAPLRVVVPGRIFRSEATDACHEMNFHQMEGLMIDEGISIANLTASLREVFSAIFEQRVKVRLRPGYFPFVEPGFEVDINCTICGGAGCPACKHSGWLEAGGCGMVHPKVLEYGKIDPKKYSGFAFGLGIERLVMMKYGINDIRFFHGGDKRFLEQF